MPQLKLDRLPDRTPVKMSVTLTPELAKTLQDYAEVYRSAYGQREKVEELVPFMLEKFIESDRGFAKARKAIDAERTACGRTGASIPSRRTEPKGDD